MSDLIQNCDVSIFLQPEAKLNASIVTATMTIAVPTLSIGQPLPPSNYAKAVA